MENYGLKILLIVARSDKNAVGELSYEHRLGLYAFLCASVVFSGQLFHRRIGESLWPLDGICESTCASPPSYQNNNQVNDRFWWLGWMAPALAQSQPPVSSFLTLSKFIRLSLKSLTKLWASYISQRVNVGENPTPNKLEWRRIHWGLKAFDLNRCMRAVTED